MSELINILLVDDVARNLDALEAVLESTDYRLLRAEGPEQALHLLRLHQVAAIVLDVIMPGMSGLELAHLIKGIKRFREVPILFLTAHQLHERDILAGYDTGAVDYLTKPANPAILRHKIAIFAELFRKERKLAELNASLELRVRERTAALAKSEEELRKTSQQKDVFVATLAHELRNPLAPLRTGLDLLQRGQESEEDRARALTIMSRQLDHMVRLVDDLLDVSRISRGTLELRLARADLRSVVEQAVEMVRPWLSQRDLSVSIAGEPSVVARVDATRVKQVLANLLHNGSKHSPQGATLQLTLRRVGERAVISVTDPGVGIPADELEHIFDLFAKVAGALPGASEGLGIGLALARELASLHGGTLTASSPGSGLGATFELAIPVGEVAAQVSLAPRSPEEPGSRLRVLLVEDNDDSAEMLKRWLGRLGHEVEAARTGLLALTLIQQTNFDLVLCDIGLPDIDGVELARRVREELTAPPAMIALTGWGTEQDRRRTAEVGFAEHLVKPVALDELRALLGRISERAARGKP
ncbi:MAG TPA: response regulator [Polyangiales bacterium]|nr:response regulator [Polyangiales bacterium]